MDAIVPKDWKIEKLAEGFGWAEGPIWVKSGGYLLFTDVPGNKMWKWSEKGGLEKFLDPSGAAEPRSRTSGARPAPTASRSSTQNSILLADTGNRGIQRLDLATKKKTPVAMQLRGQEILEPQRRDAHEDRRGVLHRSAVRLQEVRRRAGEGNPVQRRVSHGTDGKVTAIEKELHRPNGVALSPDESVLYVAQSEPTKAIIMAYSLDTNGNVTGKKLFHDITDLVSKDAPGCPDGLTVAADGTIFATGPGGVLVLSKDGKRLGRIGDGKPTANCKFGDDGRTLYLTSHDMLARIRLNIKGAGF